MVNANPSSCSNSQFATPEHHQKIADNYLASWNGDLSLVKATFAPKLQFFGDRFPTSDGTGSALLTITSAEEFEAFIRKARAGWEKYEFTRLGWAAQGDWIFQRWTMNGIVGEGFPIPT